MVALQHDHSGQEFIGRKIMITKKDFVVTVKNDDGSEQNTNYFVKAPSQEAIKGADRYRAKTWNQCLMDGIITKKELQAVLLKRGLWSEEKEAEEKRIGTELFELEKKLFLGDGAKKAKVSDGKKIVMQMKELRVKLRDHIAERIGMEENTAEALADNARFDYLVSECVFHEDGSRVYKDIDDYNQKSSDQVSILGATNLAQLLYQYDSKFEESLPENAWLKKLGLVNDKLELVDEQGELVDQEGRRINNLGHYINDEGKRVDVNGNLLNEDGSYVLQVEYEKDAKKRAK
jgi:hypothetical protein